MDKCSCQISMGAFERRFEFETLAELETEISRFVNDALRAAAMLVPLLDKPKEKPCLLNRN